MKKNSSVMVLAVSAVTALILGVGLAAMPVVQADSGGGMMGWLAGPRQGLSGTQCLGNQSGYGPGAPYGDLPSDRSGVGDLEQAESRFQAYVDSSRYDGLAITEVMEFADNYYAIVAEDSTGIGAFELILDKRTGAVTPEQGPNMMWNTKYGMHGGGEMMGHWQGTSQMVLTPDQAVAATQEWLDENLPGRTTGEPDAFFGYYTLHFLQDGEVEGMLSVNGSTGQVWYHTWHGAFVQMTEHEG